MPAPTKKLEYNLDLLVNEVIAKIVDASDHFEQDNAAVSPMDILSSILVTHLNADLLDGLHATAFAAASHTQDLSTITSVAGSGDLVDLTTVLGVIVEHDSGITTANVSTAVADMHVQNTDTGTTNADFMLNSGVAANKVDLITAAGHILSLEDGSGNKVLVKGNQFQSFIGVGQAPIVVASTTVCTNLNTDLLDGVHAAGLVNLNLVQYTAAGTELTDSGLSVANVSAAVGASHAQNTDTGTSNASFSIKATTPADVVSLLATGHELEVSDGSGNFTPVEALDYISTVATGTAPFTISSTTKVTNLNVDMVDSVHVVNPVNGNLLEYLAAGTEITDAGISVSDCSSAVSLRHTQNTDTGTTANTFIINSGNILQKCYIVCDTGSHGAVFQDGSANYAPVTASQLSTTVATGLIPLLVSSETLCTHLNADMVDGSHAAAFATSGHTHIYSTITSVGVTNGHFIDSNTGVLHDSGYTSASFAAASHNQALSTITTAATSGNLIVSNGTNLVDKGDAIAADSAKLSGESLTTLKANDDNNWTDPVYNHYQNLVTLHYHSFLYAGKASAENLTSGQYFDGCGGTGITLTAGLWLIIGAINFYRNGATVQSTDFEIGFTTTSGNNGAGQVYTVNWAIDQSLAPTSFLHHTMEIHGTVGCDGSKITLSDGTVLANACVLYLKGYADSWNAGNLQAYHSSIQAIRIG